MIDKARFILEYEPFYFWRNAVLSLVLFLGMAAIWLTLTVSLWFVILAFPVNVLLHGFHQMFWRSAYRIAEAEKKTQELKERE